MKKYMKIASVALSVSLAIQTASFAKGWDESNATTEYDSPALRYVAGKMADGAWDVTQMAGNATWAVGSAVFNGTYKLGAYVLEGGARLGVAYGTSYLGVELLNEALAYGMYGAAFTVTAFSVAGIGAAPVAGQTAYTMTRTVLAALHHIPGIDGALAATYTPVVRNFTDMVIDHGPAAICSLGTTAYSMVGSAASLASTGFSSLSTGLFNLYTAAAAA